MIEIKDRSTIGVDLINRTSLLNRWDELIQEFTLLGDRETVKDLVFYKSIILDAPQVNIDKAYQIIHGVVGYME